MFEYLRSSLEMVRVIKLPTREEVRRFLDELVLDAHRLSILSEAYDRLIQEGDQYRLKEACIDRRNPERGAVQRLQVVFNELGERNISPFNTFEAYPIELRLRRAKSIPLDLEPFVSLAARIGISNDEARLLHQLETLADDDLAELRRLGQLLESEAGLAANLKRWLADESESTDVDVVQRVLWMLDALDYHWGV